MTEQEQRIAIAGACGWQDVVVVNDGEVIGLPPGFTEDQCPEGADEEVPDYLHDLNAMHEAEKTLPPTRRGYYNAELFKVASGRNLSSAIKGPEFIFMALNATAAQRAEAFLRTIGKWKE